MTDWNQATRQWLDEFPTHGVLTTDAELNVRGWNKWLESRSGRGADDVIGRNLLELYPDLVERGLERYYRGALAGQVQVLAQRFHCYLLPMPSDYHAEEMAQSIQVAPLTEGGRVIGTITVIQDVTERVAREDALRESEARHRERQVYLEGILTAVPDAIVTLHVEHRVVEWNPGAVKLFGYSPEEAMGRDLDDLITAPDVREEAVELTKVVLGGQSVEPFETVRYHRDGSAVHVVVAGAPILIEDELIGVVAAYVDITARVRAEEALEKRVTQLALLNEIGGKIAAVLQPDILLDGTARLVQESFGYHHAALFTLDRERDELEMKARAGSFASLFPPDHRIRLGQGMVGWVGLHGETILANDVDAEPRYVNLHPEVIPTRSELSVPIRAGGEIVGVFDVQSPQLNAFDEHDVMLIETLADQLAIAFENAGLVEGLEVQVAARTAEIRAEKEKSETILRGVGDAIFMADHELRIRYVNPAFTALTGFTAQEVLGQHASSVWTGTPSEQVEQSIQLALVEGKLWQGEVTIRRKDGRTYEAAMTAAPMHDVEGHLIGYVSSHRDISRRKELERARSRFITNVSHELRTPVTNMKLYAHLLRKGLYSEKAGDYLQVLERQARRLEELIQDTLKMTVLDSGQAVTRWEPVSLPAVITAAVARYQSQAEAAGLVLRATPVPPNLPDVNGDQGRLIQALNELVENAVIFTPAGGQVTVEAGTVEEERRHWVIVAVRDTGPGISAEEQERVFDRFFRGSLAESGHVPGTGLGLSIAQEILRAHGGRITVESREGEGSAFTLWLRIVHS